MRKKTAIITGITGQSGSYMAELLLEKNYKVVGIIRRNSVPENQTYRINHLLENPNLQLVYGDMEDLSGLIHILKDHKPKEIFSLAAQSHVRISFDIPIYTTNSIAIGTLNLLEAIRIICPDVRLYNSGSSEMFGNNIDSDGMQRETTPMNPVSPYGCAKTFAFNICKNYRHSYNLFIASGITYNHESPRRGINFVTGKVAHEAVRIKKGLINKLPMGNLDAARDWGHAKDYVKAQWKMLQLETPDDFVIATGVSHTIRDLLSYVFSSLDLNYEDYVIQDKKYLRPEELSILRGDASKAKKILNWEPTYTFETLMDEMIGHWMNFYS